MRARHMFAGVTAVATGAGLYAIFGGNEPPASQLVAAITGRPRRVSCPARRQIVDIHNTGLRAMDGMTVRLGPDVDLDFSTFPIDSLPLSFRRCVTLTSISAFDDPVISPGVGATTARSGVPKEN